MLRTRPTVRLQSEPRQKCEGRQGRPGALFHFRTDSFLCLATVGRRAVAARPAPNSAVNATLFAALANPAQN